MKFNAFIAALITTSSLITVSAFASLNTGRLNTVNDTNYTQFQYKATSYGAAFIHKPSNPYNGNGYFSGTDGIRSFVGDVTFYPVGAVDNSHKCEVYFWTNGHYGIEAVPSADYTCTVSRVSQGREAVLQLTFARQ